MIPVTGVGAFVIKSVTLPFEQRVRGEEEARCEAG
jgi:hypothetical protein